jgi:hypothetical protein
MDRTELTDTELDADIARHLQALLTAEPSAEFLPAMRRRLATEPVRSGWGVRWTMPLAGAVTAAIVVGVVLLRTPTPMPLDQPRNPAPHVVPKQEPVASVPALKISAPAGHRSRHVAAIVQTKPSEPEVLVSPGEAAALRRWLTDISAGRVELSAAHLPASVDEVSELTGIHPLVPVTIQEGVLQ